MLATVLGLLMALEGLEAYSEQKRSVDPRSIEAAAESVSDEIFEELPDGAASTVSRAAALERMVQALDTAKRARDHGRDVSRVRVQLKQARAAFEGGDYAKASRLAAEILRDL